MTAPAPAMGQARLMQGNEAIAEGAIAAGCRFYAGYPITPSTEIAEVLASRLPQVGGVFIQMEDELASMGAIIGASLTGVKAMTATSGPGFSLMQENLGFAAMAEVPCVVVNVQRGGPSTGLPTDPAQGDMMQARWGTHGEHSIIALVPSSVEECFHMTVQAFNLAERFRTPVIILSDALIAHMRESVALPPYDQVRVVERPMPSVPPDDYMPFASTTRKIVPLAPLGSEYRYSVTGLVYDSSGFPNTNDPGVANSLGHRLREKIYLHRKQIVLVEEMEMRDAEVAIFAYGSVARSAVSAMRWARERGVPVGVVRPITIWPFPTKQVERMADQVRTVIVPELNIKQISWQVRAAIGGRAKVRELGRVDGKLITPEQIIDMFKKDFYYHFH